MTSASSGRKSQYTSRALGGAHRTPSSVSLMRPENSPDVLDQPCDAILAQLWRALSEPVSCPDQDIVSQLYQQHDHLLCRQQVFANYRQPQAMLIALLSICSSGRKPSSASSDAWRKSIGTDMRRFPSARLLASWARMCPGRG